jgi:hypothetical protein
MECTIDGILRPSRIIGLKPRPSGIKRLKTAVTIPDATKAISVKISKKKPFFEAKEWPWDSSRQFKYVLPGKQAKTKRVKGPSVYLVRAVDTESSQFFR